MEKRAWVVEHRVTVTIPGYIQYKARFWIEGDPDHGGVATLELAKKGVDAACKMLVGYDGRGTDRLGCAEIADFLLTLFPAANSVEVCDQVGDGTAIHRDWP